jgi:SAM-dependent methyltransferase
MTFLAKLETCRKIGCVINNSRIIRNIKNCYRRLIESYERYIRKQEFFPGIGGLFINPFYHTRKILVKEISCLSSFINGIVLDAGCGQKPYESLFGCDQYVGLELDTPETRQNNKVDLFYDGKHIPKEDDYFDSIVMFEVFEHVFNPDEFMAELYRVLKPGGVMLMTVPFVWEEHTQPYDYARYSSFGIKSILEKRGFEILEQKKTLSDIRILFQLINSYLFRFLNSHNTNINMFLCFIFMSPLNILGQILYKIFPKNENLYLDNVILAKKADI